MSATIETDILVIGAGPTGAAAAWRLAAAGRDVTIVERGDWIDHAALRRDDPDFEVRRAGPLSSNPNIRRAAFDPPIDDARTPIKPMIGNNVGGGSAYWSAHVPRFRPEDFRTATLDGVGDDWPVSYDDLAPYYELNEARLGVARVDGDPSAPSHGGEAFRLPTLGAHGRRFAQAFDRLGWHWWPVDLVVGRDADAPGTIHCTHVGPCDLGCPSRRRSNADRSYVTDALEAGARLLTRTRVLRLDHDAPRRVNRARCVGEDGPVTISARTLVLAANGLGTPHLLLRSASDAHPEGLANGSGLVGRNLMLHPYARVDGIFDEPVGAWVSGEKAGLVSFEFFKTAAARGFVRGLKLQLTGGPPPVALAQGAPTSVPLPWGEGHHRAFEEMFDHVCGFTVCVEDLADPDNRVTLSDTVRDADGLPAAAMTYTVSANARRALDFGLERAAEVLREAGATRTVSTPLRSQSGFHLMGTTRAGDDSATSVVDRFGRAHGVDNLFVVDASVFVTASSINPTATAQAWALRTADHILETT